MKQDGVTDCEIRAKKERLMSAAAVTNLQANAWRLSSAPTNLFTRCGSHYFTFFHFRLHNRRRADTGTCINSG
jgi:hypothetical protein